MSQPQPLKPRHPATMPPPDPDWPQPDDAPERRRTPDHARRDRHRQLGDPELEFPEHPMPGQLH